MMIEDQIDSWFETGEYESIAHTISDLPGYAQTDHLLNDLVVAYNNLGEYGKAILILEELKAQFFCTARWQYRMGYALYYSAMKSVRLSKTEKLLKNAREAFSLALKLNPEEYVKQDCLEFLQWIDEDLAYL